MNLLANSNVFVVFGSSAIAARIGRAIGPGAELRAVANNSLDNLPSTAEIILIDEEALRFIGVDALQCFRALRPRAALVGIVDRCSSSVDLSFRLGQLGFDALIFHEHDHEPAISIHTLRHLRIRASAQLCADTLGLDYPTLGRLPLAAAFRRIETIRTPRALADALEISPERLRILLHPCRLPRTRSFLAWMRLLVATRLLEDRSWTIESVALKLDYSSGPALANAFKHVVGVTASELRDGGGLAAAMQALRVLTDTQSRVL